MSKTGDKIFKYALDKGRSVKNTLWIAGCFLLVAQFTGTVIADLKRTLQSTR